MASNQQNMPMVFFGLACLALVAIICVLVIIGQISEGRKNKKERNNKEERPKNEKIQSTPPRTDSTGTYQAQKKPHAQTSHDSIGKIVKDVKKVAKLVGIASFFDDKLAIDDIRNGRLEAAAEKVAQKLSIKHPSIQITRKTEREYTEDGRVLVANVRVSQKNEAIFGTPGFDYQTIHINVFPEAISYPEKFIYILAHELCHKILHSLDRNRDDEAQDERETDIAASLLGFSKSFEIAKRIDPGIGYLTAEESAYLVSTCDIILESICDDRKRYYKDYVSLRQRNDEKVLFLDNLYRARALQGEGEWSVDYATSGNDYNKLLICTKAISLKQLKRYNELCEFFKSMNDNRSRYSYDILDAGKYFDELTAIIRSVDAPSFDAASVLKGYK